jgi:hypothetical protein
MNANDTTIHALLRVAATERWTFPPASMKSLNAVFHALAWRGR